MIPNFTLFFRYNNTKDNVDQDTGKNYAQGRCEGIKDSHYCWVHFEIFRNPSANSGDHPVLSRTL
jgi:hypothetical protein